MKNLILFFTIIIAPIISNGAQLDNCFNESSNSLEFNNCVNQEIGNDFDINDFLYNEPPTDPGYDCSVYRNYRDRNGNYVCPTTDYDACLKEYGPRLPPPYFEFVKHWCWCNCVYDPDDV